MTLLFAILVLLALTGLVVWYVVDRLWHLFVILVLGAALFPWVALTLIGDVSRYFPVETFSNVIVGKDEIVLASAATTISVAIILAASACAAVRAVWRIARRS